MKTSLLTFIVILTIGCVPSNSNVQKEKIEDRSFFDFDEVIHYSVGIETKTYEADDAQELSEKQKIKNGIIVGNTLNTFDDTVYVSKMKEIGFIQKVIARKRHHGINKIFSEKEIDEMSMTDCIPVYRDIFIFKKRNRITGIAKICFECGQSIIIGTEKNTFGFETRLRSLKRLLK